MNDPIQYMREKAVLGGLLIDNDKLPEILDILEPSDFEHQANLEIFIVLTDLFNKNEPIDLITLPASLKEKGLFEVVGGAVYLSELIDAVPSAANIIHYARKIRDGHLN